MKKWIESKGKNNTIPSREGGTKAGLLDSKGMEMVQVAILVAIAIALGLIFRTEITAFINKTFTSLNSGF